MPNKIKNPIIVEGITLFFSWIFGLIIDEAIQSNIREYPNSYKSYQLIQNILNVEDIIAQALIFLWIMGTLFYVFKKFSN